MRLALFAALRGSILDFSRRQNAIFWISQLAIVFSTIVGVYLASSEGLKSAVQFHYAITTEKKYYTLNALHSEVLNNNNLMLAFGKDNLNRDEKGKVESLNSRRIPALNWFVWTTMMQSTDSLELPVDILRDVNIYYLELTRLSERYSRSGGRDKLFSASKLDDLVQEANSGVLARMEEQLVSYKEQMRKYPSLGKH